MLECFNLPSQALFLEISTSASKQTFQTVKGSSLEPLPRHLSPGEAHFPFTFRLYFKLFWTATPLRLPSDTFQACPGEPWPSQFCLVPRKLVSPFSDPTFSILLLLFSNTVTLRPPNFAMSQSAQSRTKRMRAVSPSEELPNSTA